MPSLTLNEIEKYSQFLPNVFIETGTYHGDTVNNVLNKFKQIYSIELSQTYARYAKNRFVNNANVQIIEGDSVDILSDICTEIKDTIFFWLDGHWSGGDTARGSLDCPLLKEIEIINNSVKNKCIIAIDDVRLFCTNIDHNWLNITRENILSIVKNRLISCEYFPSSLYAEDRMILHLKEI